MRIHSIPALLLTVAAIPASAQETTPRPTNVVLIMADDLGYECIGVNGGTSYATPRIDRMAAEGIRFTNCHSTPLCTPSRVQIMTGRYSFRNYVRFGYLDPEETTFAELLRDAGYATCIAGKWQLTYGDIDADRPEELGFDEWCLWNSRETPGPRYADPRLDFDGEVRDMPDAFGPDVVSKRAIEFVREHRDEPFFLYYPMILPHSPFVRTPDSVGSGKTKQDRFADMVAYVDTLVGRVLDVLVELDIDENTLVLFVGDNGTDRRIRSVWNGREIVGGKSRMTMAGTHVPLIAWWPGTAAPAVLDDLIDFTDFLPTLCEVGAVTVDPAITIDGRSFLPRLRGQAGAPRDWIFCHYDPRWNVPGRPGRYAFDGHFKLHDDGRLFDVVRDRAEEHPLGEPADDAAAARARLQAVLDSMPRWDPPEKARRPER